MDFIDNIQSLSLGARFLRGDLHIHFVSASHDVKDATMTPVNIVAVAKTEGLAFIVITYHNEIFNVGLALVAAENTEVAVIPAVELSTHEGHLLVYSKSLQILPLPGRRRKLEEPGFGQLNSSRYATWRLRTV